MSTLKNDGNELKQEEEIQLVIFEIDRGEYGVNILDVQEIIRVPSITKVPRAPVFVEGIINLRGQVLPVIDLRKRLGTQEKDLDFTSRIIVVAQNGRRVGLIVDAVREVTRIPRSSIEPAPPEVLDVDSQFVEGVGKKGDRLLVLLKLDKVLSVKEQKELSVFQNKAETLAS